MTMDKILGNFLTQANKDFPLDCETLDYLQKLVALAAIAGNIGGDRVVLWGCEPNSEGTRRGAGYVFVRTKNAPEGEVLPWDGGPTTSGMYVKQEAIPVSANNTDYPKAYTRRSLAPGIGEENYTWESFTDIKSIKGLMDENRSLRNELAAVQPAPLGIVQMWAGSRVPQGYVLCDGQPLRKSDHPELFNAIGSTFNTAVNANGVRYTTQDGYFRVPDLRGRFVVGLHDSDRDYESPGTGGGLKKVTLTEETIPRHSHEEMLWKGGSGDWKGHGSNSWPNATTIFECSPHGINTLDYGKGEAHENRPPYYVLAYIMRVK